MLRPVSRVSLLIAPALLLGCSVAVNTGTADCSAQAGWSAGLALQAPACAGQAEYSEAHDLGSELRRLRDAQAALARQAEASTDAAERARLQREQRQRQIDIEAIEGVAVVNGWRSGA